MPSFVLSEEAFPFLMGGSARVQPAPPGAREAGFLLVPGAPGSEGRGNRPGSVLGLPRVGPKLSALYLLGTLNFF